MTGLCEPRLRSGASEEGRQLDSLVESAAVCRHAATLHGMFMQGRPACHRLTRWENGGDCA
jgi:hypothetical protein